MGADFLKASKTRKLWLSISIVLLVSLGFAVDMIYKDTPSQKAISCASEFMKNKKSFSYEPSNTENIKWFKAVWNSTRVKNYRYAKIKRGLYSMTNVYTVTFHAALEYKNGKTDKMDVDVCVIVRADNTCVLYSASPDIDLNKATVR